MPRFELNPDTRLLAEALLRLAPGGALSYAEIGALLARRVSGGDPVVQAARRKAERADGFVFTTDRKQGLRRLTDAEITELGGIAAGRIRRAARRAARRTSNVADYAALSPADRARLNAGLALLGAVTACTAPSMVQRIEKACANGQPLPLAATLAMFQNPKTEAPA